MNHNEYVKSLKKTLSLLESVSLFVTKKGDEDRKKPGRWFEHNYDAHGGIILSSMLSVDYLLKLIDSDAEYKTVMKK